MKPSKNNSPREKLHASLVPGPVRITWRPSNDSDAPKKRSVWPSWRPLPSLQPLANTLAPPPERVPSTRSTKHRWLVAAAAAVAVLGLAGSCATPAQHRSDAPHVNVVRCLGAPSLKNAPSGGHVRWHQDTIDVVLDPSLDQLAAGGRAAVRDAVDTWMGKAEIPSVTVDESSEHGEAKRDGVNRIVAGPITLPGHEKDLAITMTYVDQDTGELVEADMIINTRYHWGLVRPAAPEVLVDPDNRPGAKHTQRTMEKPASCGHRFDVQNVTTHEFGHFFGLGEDMNDPDATMFYKSARCETKKRTLSSDDLQVIDGLYQESDDDPSVGCSMSIRGTSSKTRWGWILVAAGVFAACRRRRAI